MTFRNGLTFVWVGGLAHSFWRTLEYNLWLQYKQLLLSPVLDLGCGDGIFASVMPWNSGDVIGIDLDIEATKRAKALNIYHALFLADATKGLPFRSNTFRTVFSNSVLEHIPDTDGVVSEISRVLRPDGHLLFTVPNQRFTEYGAQLFGTEEADWINHKLDHRRLLSGEEWEYYLDRHGFVVEKQRTHMNKHFILWYRWLISVYMVRWPFIQKLVYSMMSRRIMEVLSMALDVPEGANTLFIARKK